MKKVNIKDLGPGYSIFGNKGNVWSGTAHAYKSGFGPGSGNLCGTPALRWSITIAPSIVFLAPSSWIRPWCRNSQPCLIAEKAPCASMRRENGSTSYMPKNLWMNVAAVPGPSKTQAITAYNKYSILVMRFSPSRNVRSMLL